MDRFPDSNVRSATAVVTRHSIVNIIIRWVRVTFEQGSGGHNLSCLAVPTLRDILVNPYLL
jgi:hypothetical protein